MGRQTICIVDAHYLISKTASLLAEKDDCVSHSNKALFKQRLLNGQHTFISINHVRIMNTSNTQHSILNILLKITFLASLPKLKLSARLFSSSQRFTQISQSLKSSNAEQRREEKISTTFLSYQTNLPLSLKLVLMTQMM